MAIPIGVGAFCMVPKGLEERLEELETRGRIKTIQNIVLLKSEYSEEFWGDFCHSDFSVRPPVKTGMKNSHTVK